MLAAYFDLPVSAAGAAFGPKKPKQPAKQQPAKQQPAKQQPKAKAKPSSSHHSSHQPPRPCEASTTNVHAGFEPLPAEKNAPVPAEPRSDHTWQALDPGLDPGAVRADEVCDWEDEEEGPEDVDRDDVSEPDFEPESLDPLAAAEVESLGSSVDDQSLHSFFATRRCKGKPSHASRAVYSGPMLCCEDDEFDDE
jgi:hypothetical protein